MLIHNLLGLTVDYIFTKPQFRTKNKSYSALQLKPNQENFQRLAKQAFENFLGLVLDFRLVVAIHEFPLHFLCQA